MTRELDGVQLAVIGAGSMGAGIAQLAAMSGHTVRLYDNNPNAAQEALESIGSRIRTKVEKGKLPAGADREILSRLEVVETLAQMSTAGLIVEAIVEELDAKRELFRELEKSIDPTTILASNTSSLSVTALSAELQHPERFLGLHFFNPVPVMRLVEIVPSLSTDPALIEQLSSLMKAWGRQPVRARNTPGFIVNRIARPFYAEALLILENGWATASDVDDFICSAGFRMGPFRLMDMIGNDVNYAVTESVFKAFYFDRRYLPSHIQRELVDGGMLGKKTGRGFYSYPEKVKKVTKDRLQPCAEPRPDGWVVKVKELGHPLVSHCRHHSLELVLDPSLDSEYGGFYISHEDTEQSIYIQETDGRTAKQLSQQHQLPCLVYDWGLVGATSTIRMCATSEDLSEEGWEAARFLLNLLGISLRYSGDSPGLCVARTISMIINEAADAVQLGVCDEQAANLAMCLGTNYPAGPFEWLSSIGVARVVELLERLAAGYCPERYRVSPGLRQRLKVVV